ncbi:MAG: UDP-3-O-(3-hydroxymyristoyl)glucosamine N-acyltransferase [Acidobacteria bacterium]|nr:UDP-3-O-(3-hydroxymyristoyl)glucosamine N-acyltransferase [Acidobacteriota bacterium]
MKLRALAERLQCRLEGDGDLDILRVAGLEQASAGDVSFLANPRYRGLLSTTRASAVILDPRESLGGAPAFAVLRCDHPYLAFAGALQLLEAPAPPAPGIDGLSSIAPDARIGPEAAIGPFVVVGAGAVVGARAVFYPGVVVGPGAQIGDDCVFHAHVSVRERVTIGNRVVVLDGAVIGSDGFGFARRPDGAHVKIPQRAAVVVEDDVEIGANTTIDRPAVGETRIQAGAKIDNLVQIAHGVRIGARSLLAAQVGIAGSTIVEEEVMLGGQVGVTGHVRVGKGAMASAKTGITGHVDAGMLVSGYPSLPNVEWRKAQVLVRRLPEMKRRIAEMEQRIAEMEEKLATCRMLRDRR